MVGFNDNFWVIEEMSLSFDKSGFYMATFEVRAGMHRFSSARMCLYWGCKSHRFLSSRFSRSSYLFQLALSSQLYVFSQSGDIPHLPGDIPGALLIWIMDGVTDYGSNHTLQVEVNIMVARVVLTDSLWDSHFHRNQVSWWGFKIPNSCTDLEFKASYV